MAPDAPLLHATRAASRPQWQHLRDIARRGRQRGRGVRRGRRCLHERTYSTSRVQHAHMETHGSIAWRDADGRVHVRTSTQAPFITHQKLVYLFGLRARDLHVFTERVGGGFGGKQEMLTEDLCVLAALKTRPPGEVGIHPRRSSSPAPPRATR